MAKNLEISILLDFYGDMLTDKQKEVVEFYYNEDLSLSEIAEHSGITRQGVRDSIKRAEVQLIEFEERLGLAKKFKKIQDGLDFIISTANDIDFYNTKYTAAPEIAKKCSLIINTAKELNE